VISRVRESTVLTGALIRALPRDYAAPRPRVIRGHVQLREG
jgi:hypothetical protein